MTRLVSLLFHDVFVGEPSESGFSSPSADRYKLTLEAFDEQLALLSRSRREAPGLGAAFASGEGLPFTITFDDGGVSYYTIVADRLERLGWRGHCFVCTDTIGRPGFVDTSQLRELDARGHIIGSHSASHPTRFSACTRDEMFSEWNRSRLILEDLLGHRVVAASLPGGDFSGDAATTAAAAGVQVLFTSEPTTRVWHVTPNCAVAGRFTVRRGSPRDRAARLVGPSAWPRMASWVNWNAKGLVKPLLGSSYSRIAEWLIAESRRPLSR
jgi:peptidoglycan/xylan/chitin deacetylase (PgdA/CDA1 family)